MVACRAPAAPAPPQLARWDDGAVHVTGAPRLDREIARALEPYADVAGWRLFDISDDARRVLAGRRGELFELDAPGAEPRAIAADGAVRWAAYIAGSIAVATDRDGDERMVLARDGVRIAENVADPVAAHGHVAWAEHVDDGKRTFVWLDDHVLFAGDGAWQPLDVSVDARTLLVRHRVGRESTVARYDVATAAMRALAPAIDARFGARDEIYALADVGGKTRVGAIGDGFEPLAIGGGEIDQLAVAPDRQAIAFTANDDGASAAFVYERAVRAVDVARGGVISDLRFPRTGAGLAFTFTDPQHARTVYANGIAWTRDDAPALHPVAPQRATVASFDGAPIHVDLYAPPARAPVVVELHGGPEDQWRPRWQPFEQFLVSRGYAVVQPNVRGSSGYGAAFAALDDGVHREDAVRDVGAVLDWIATRPDLDPTRVVVLGTSYGGYLALAALARFPDRLRGGIVLSAITDFVAFLEGTRADRRDDRRAEYGDERDPHTRAFLARISPSAHVAAIRAPLLVAHGRRDPRVPIDATDRFVAALRAAGRTVWYVVADDEGHTFAKAENRGVFEVLAVQFLDGLR